MGILLYGASNNSVSGNNITANKYIGIYLDESSNNRIFHNNILVLNNTAQVEVDRALNIWDNGYPSGGNYWSEYNGTDIYSGAYQNQTGSDGIGDTPYVINENNRDNYPLMNPWPSGPGLHELETALRAPTRLQLGNSTLIEAVVTNNGGNTQQNVAFSLFINNTIVNSTTISTLEPASSNTIMYSWTPTAEGTYNITAYASPVPGETSLENNHMTEFVTVTISAPPGLQVGVKAGDWIKCTYTISGWPSGTPYPEWLKVEFLSVEGINATVRVTMHMSDGTEPSQTMTIDVVAGGGTFQGLSGFVIPANCTTGDSIYISGYGNVTIAGETTSSYAGATRTVVHASFSQYGTQLTYYWDKLTGAMVEASVVSGGVTATGKTTETNMWQAGLSGLPIDPIYLYVLAALVIIIAGAAAAFIVRRRKKTPEEVENSQSELRLTRTGLKRNFGHRITHVQTEW
jgi:parallel beta-helix repeat protein